MLATVRRAQRGDRAAFTALVREFQDGIFSFACNYFRDREEAFDLTQEVFIRVWRKLDQFRGDSKFSTWLYRVTVNLCKNRSETRRTQVSREVATVVVDDEGQEQDTLAALPDPGPGPEEGALMGDIRAQVQAAVHRLPAVQRSLILLCDFDARSYDEIAAITGLSLAAVKTNIHRARLKLREQLQPLWERENPQ